MDCSGCEAIRQPVRSLPIVVLLTLLVTLAYWNTLENGFPLDDQALVEENTLMTRMDYLPTLLTSDYWAGARDPAVARNIESGLYRPLVLLSFAFNYAVSGRQPRDYHLVNVLLHLLVAFLVYALALQIGISLLGALVSAVLFAVHPIHTEPVASIVGRAELLMAVGVLAGLRWAIQDRLVLSLCAFVLALLSKEQAVMLPVLLMLYDCTRGKPWENGTGWGAKLHALLARYGPYAVVLAAYAILRSLALGGLHPPPARFLHNPLPYLDLPQRLFTAMKVAGQYLWLCLWPHALSADYSYDAIPVSQSLFDAGVIFGIVVWGGLCILALWMYRRTPVITFAVGFLALTFLPVSNLIVPIGTIMGERLFYLPSVGLCLLIGLAYERVTTRSDVRSTTYDVRRTSQVIPRIPPASHLVPRTSNFAPRTVASTIALALVCLGLTLRTIDRNRAWVNSESAMDAVLQVYPNNAKAHAWLAETAIEHRDWDAALRHSEEAVRIYPDYEATDSVILTTYGLALVETGHIPEGIAKMERASALDPTWSELSRLLGVAYAKAQRYVEAEHAFQQAVRLNPDNRHAHFGLSYLYLERGNYEPAVHEAEDALRSRPDFMEPRYIRARALEALGRNQEALEEYARVMRFPQAPADVAERFYRLHAAQQGSTTTLPDRTQAFH